MTGRIVQINVSPGGVPKLPVPRVRVTALGLEGDGHRSEHHGGAERALCLFALERLEALRAEGHPVVPGGLGENLTVAGLDWAAVGPGDRFRLGDGVVIEVTRFTNPCLYLTNLDQLGRDRVRFVALPLRLDGAEGAPARAIALLD